MKRLLLYIATAALAFSSTSCELDFDPQGGSYTEEMIQEIVKKDPDKILAPYAQSLVGAMHGYQRWNFPMDLQGNDLVLYKTDNHYKNEYQFINLRGATDGFAAGKWSLYFSMVYEANQILATIPKIDENKEGLSKSENAVLGYKALALTFRGMGYYYLMTLFQDDYMHGGKDKPGVPIYLIAGEAAKGRAASTEVYQQIITDLKEAVRLYEKCGYDPRASVEDMDQTVSNLILARAAVTCGEYETAIAAAKAVIDAGYELMGESEYVTTISANGELQGGNGFQSLDQKETIMGYRWSNSTSHGVDAFASFMSCWGNGYASATGGAYYTGIDKRLYDQIPNSDYRKKNFVGKDGIKVTYDGKNITIPAYVNTKFAVPSYQVDEVYFRVSEAYLLKAEAEARSGNEAAAQETLYNLISKRDASYKKSSKTGAALLEEIFVQIRVELWGEGHEYYTNKRFDEGVDRTGDTNHTDHSVHPAGKFFTYMIPIEELQRNPHINENNPM